MIFCREADEFIPYGRGHVIHHPEDVWRLPSCPSIPEEDMLEDSNWQNLSDPKDKWIIRKCADGITEEELYYSQRIAVWSRGQMTNEGSKSIIKSMTRESKIIQAFFCSFYTYPDLPILIDDDISDEPTGRELPSICIIEKDCLGIYVENGEDYSVALPFPVKKAWPMKYGILLEREVQASELTKPSKETLPILYSLLHPLDEILPVIMKSAQLNPPNIADYVKNSKHVTVAVLEEPSLFITYDTSSSTIKIARIRRAIIEENVSLLQGSIGSLALSSLNHLLSASGSHTPLGLSPCNFMSPSLSQMSPSLPFTVPRRNTSMGALTPRLLTPQSHIASMSRTYSPSLSNAQHIRLGLSPSIGKPTALRTTRLALSLMNESNAIEPEPLVPNICLHYFWSNTLEARPVAGFTTEDAVGQRYLCVRLDNSTLKCFRYECTADQSSIIIGSEVSIQAKDAISVIGRKMMVVVEIFNSLMIYTGPLPLCKLLLGGLPSFSSTLFKDFSCLNISQSGSAFATPVRRSTLLPTGRPVSPVRFQMDDVLSPVTNEKIASQSFGEDQLPISAAVVCLRDATDTKLTLEHVSGTYYRISLPEMFSSAIVEKAFLALKYVLPREQAMYFISKWYVKRNSPGNGDFCGRSEWKLFAETLLHLIGYDVSKLSKPGSDFANQSSPYNCPKKFRGIESGSDSDWDYLLASSYHKTLGSDWKDVLGLDCLVTADESEKILVGNMDTSAILFPYLPSILYALHLVYEEFKIRMTDWSHCSIMLPCLCQLAVDAKTDMYIHYYWRDFPKLCSLRGPPAHLRDEHKSLISYPSYFTEHPPNLYKNILSIISRKETSFPYIPEVTKGIKQVVMLYCCAVFNYPIKELKSRFLRPLRLKTRCSVAEGHYDCNKEAQQSKSALTIHEKIISLMDHMKFTEDDVKSFAPGLSLLMMNAQHMSRRNPPQNWPVSAYQLIQRTDLVKQRKETDLHVMQNKKTKIFGDKDPYNVMVRIPSEKELEETSDMAKAHRLCEEEDGMEYLDWTMLKLRWPDDHRILEVRKMLVSSRPVVINIPQRPEISDHDFLEEQERHLYALCIRTMALPVGRSMFTMCTHTPIITEPFPIPPLILKGRAPPRGTTIDFPNNEIPVDLDLWPLFHNGVAGGLRISPNCFQITTTWILCNRAKSIEASVPHAGFLLGLGLNGHLRNASTVMLHDYLSQSHQLTCIGLLLGTSAAMRCTMDLQTTEVLSVHLECFLPPTSTELDVPHSVQVAAIMGIGLVYAHTGHRHIADVLLQEIGRPPGPEMEDSTDRESYSLAAALGLGLVMFGKGKEINGIPDLTLADELHRYIEGGHRKPFVGAMKEKFKSPSYQIKEGDLINIDITSPGATLALGMIYFRSGNRAVADWMVVPNTPYLLDQVRPDFLLLRTIARGLIMWDSVLPTYKWVEGHVPTNILQHVHRGGSQSTPGVDYESIHQAYYNILAGACFILGLKFAGSANSEAFYVLWKYTKMFTSFTKRSVAELAGKSTIESCMNTMLLSLSMVMAGTGDLEVFRLIRYLRSRVGSNHSTIGYGSHLAIHMSLGFLFLGGGRFSLGTSNMSVAALLISCYPKFPTHSNDNRYHLQAFRHLYVLAAEPRLLMPIDVDTGYLKMAMVNVKFSDTKSYVDQFYLVKAPNMLPELDKLDEVNIEVNEDARHWPVKFKKGSQSWIVLESLLKRGNGIPLKLREGRRPYDEIPVGPNARLPYLPSCEKSALWTVKKYHIEEAFSCATPLIKALLGTAVETANNDIITPLSQLLTTLVLEYLSVGKPEMIDCWVSVLQGLNQVNHLSQNSSLVIWQIKMIGRVSCLLQKIQASVVSFMAAANEMDAAMEVNEFVQGKELVEDIPLLSLEQTMSTEKRLGTLVDNWKNDCQHEINNYMMGQIDRTFSPKCAYTLVFKDIPLDCHNFSGSLANESNPIAILQKMQKLDPSDKSFMVSLAEEVLAKC